MEQVLPVSFQATLELGQLNERVMEHEFDYQGVNIFPTDHDSNQPFDFYLPDGRSVECKIDLRSQATNKAHFEEPTMNRAADIHIHTMTYAMVFHRAEVEQLWQRGNSVRAGDLGYNCRAVPKFVLKGRGMYLDEFIKSLKH
jgi:hypothetical protein